MNLYPVVTSRFSTNNLECYQIDKQIIFKNKYSSHYFQVENNRIYKKQNIPIYDSIKIDKYDFSIFKFKDYSKILCYSIPIEFNINENMEIKKYKINKSSLVTLIIENNNKFYFTIYSDEITKFIKDDICTFLSMLKLYN